MNDEQFWSMISEARGRSDAVLRPGLKGRLLGHRPDPERARAAFSQALESGLKALQPADIVAFKAVLEQKLDIAYRADLWEAAYVLMSGCSDDGFEYFRAWLVAQGREVFGRALEDPESLADLPVTDDPSLECEFESLLYLPAEVYEESGFGDLWEELPKRDAPLELTGELDPEESLAEKYPRIAARWWS